MHFRPKKADPVEQTGGQPLYTPTQEELGRQPTDQLAVSHPTAKVEPMCTPRLLRRHRDALGCCTPRTSPVALGAATASYFRYMLPPRNASFQQGVHAEAARASCRV